MHYFIKKNLTKCQILCAKIIISPEDGIFPIFLLLLREAMITIYKSYKSYKIYKIYKTIKR